MRLLIALLLCIATSAHPQAIAKKPTNENKSIEKTSIDTDVERKINYLIKNKKLNKELISLLNQSTRNHIEQLNYGVAYYQQKYAATIADKPGNFGSAEYFLSKYILTEVCIAIGRYIETIEVVDEVNKKTQPQNEPNEYFLLQKVHALIGINEPDRALKILDYLIAKHSKNNLRNENTVKILSYTGLALNKKQRHSDAIAMHKLALDISKELKINDPSIVQRLTTLLAMGNALNGDYKEALQKITSSPPMDVEISQIIAYNEMLSIALLQTGHIDQSIILFKINLVDILKGLEGATSITGNVFETYKIQYKPYLTVFADELITQNRFDEAQQVLDMLKEDEQFEFIRRSGDADPRRTRIGFTATERPWMERYNQIAGQLASLAAQEQELQKKAKTGLNPEEKLRLQALKQDLAVAQKAFSAFLDEMRADFKAKGQARTAELEETSAASNRELQSLLTGLGPDVALLRYYITDNKVGMLLTLPSGPIARTSNIPAKELSSHIFKLRRQLQDPKSNPLPLAQSLYRTLLAPVENDLLQANTKTVMVSLDGPLRYLPIAALHDGKRFAIERWNLPVYTSVVRNKLRDKNSPQWQAAGLGVTKAHAEFKALPAVQQELGSIIRTGSQTNSGSMPGAVYLDEAFSAKRLRDVGQQPFDVVHIASHFRFSPGTEINSFLLLGDGKRLTLGDLRTENYRFDNVDLLTLAACDTGLGGGRDANGREIEGFGVIAQQQGAKAVLATLWPVADKSTATLMADMYRRRTAQKLSKIEALQQAQIALMQQPAYKHPYYWAPFILMGNWK